MKKTVLIGFILSCFLLLVTPCINAVEYKEVREEVESKIIIDFKDFYNQIKYLINTLTNNIVINILLVLLFLYEIYLLFGTIMVWGFWEPDLSFIERILMIFISWFVQNLGTLIYNIGEFIIFLDLLIHNIIEFIEFLYDILIPNFSDIMRYNYET
jgi:hypothetical protein